MNSMASGALARLGGANTDATAEAETHYKTGPLYTNWDSCHFHNANNSTPDQNAPARASETLDRKDLQYLPDTIDEHEPTYPEQFDRKCEACTRIERPHANLLDAARYYGTSQYI